MKFLVVLMAAVACQAAPQQVLPYSIVQTAPLVAHGISNSPAVMKIPKPGIRFGVPTPVSYSAPFVAAAPAVAPVAFAAPAVAPVAVAAPASVPVAAPVQYSAPAVPAVPINAVPDPIVASAPAPPVAVVAPTVYAAAPEPLAAPEPPMPSVGKPFVGGQFHAQDEAGQYSFGHWGGPNTRVETRDFLGRTSGSFAYVDPAGDVQVRKYAAAPATGFKVAASDLP